jgi:hypothetical protein
MVVLDCINGRMGLATHECFLVDRLRPQPHQMEDHPMTITLSFGFWMVPTALTILGLINVATHRPTDAWDIGGAILMVIWGVAALTAWVMWGLTWLM